VEILPQYFTISFKALLDMPEAETGTHGKKIMTAKPVGFGYMYYC
jgi:hypothetical protein